MALMLAWLQTPYRIKVKKFREIVSYTSQSQASPEVSPVLVVGGIPEIPNFQQDKVFTFLCNL
jgi:hypothetical protein